MDSGNCTLEKGKSKHFKDFWQRVWVDSDTWILKESASSDWSTQLKHDQAPYQKLRGVLEGYPGPELPMCLAEAFFGTTLHLISFCPTLPPSLPPVGIDCKNTSYWILQASLLRVHSQVNLQHWVSKGNWWEMRGSLCVISSWSVLPASFCLSSGLCHLSPFCPLASQGKLTGDWQVGEESKASLTVLPQVGSWLQSSTEDLSSRGWPSPMSRATALPSFP